MDNPIISFLSVNYKQSEVTLQMVNSLYQLSYTNWELILVNNDDIPSPDLAQQLANNSKVIYVESGKNLGFAGGNNVGLPYCKGDYIFFVNNDTELTPSLIEDCLAVIKDYPNFGMMSPKIIFFDTPDIIQYAGSTPMSTVTIRNEGIGSMEVDKGQYDKVYKTAYIHGAAMLVPKSVIEKVGTMYTDFFLYYEELDWCERIAQAGYTIIYNGLATVYHKESVSTGVNSPLKIYYLTRNRLLFARRNYSTLPLLAAWIYFTLVAVPKNILTWSLKGRIDLAKAFWRGFTWNFSNR